MVKNLPAMQETQVIDVTWRKLDSSPQPRVAIITIMVQLSTRDLAKAFISRMKKSYIGRKERERWPITLKIHHIIRTNKTAQQVCLIKLSQISFFYITKNYTKIENIWEVYCFLQNNQNKWWSIWVSFLQKSITPLKRKKN